MAQTSKKPPKGKKKSLDFRRPKFQPIRWVKLWMKRVLIAVGAVFLLAILGYSFINPPTTPYIISERMRLGWVDHQWVDFEEIAPVMARSVVAAEDANYCNHWGFDMGAIRTAIDAGGTHGASTLSQQVVKNVYLWHGRSWPRKALEALITPMVELIWSKRRILEVYLNVAEFGEGIFGVEAAARHYFKIAPKALNATQSARLAALLPNPKERSASRPSPFVKKRARSIADGAALIAKDGRAACFKD